jgi:DNA gyrase subunit B
VAGYANTVEVTLLENGGVQVSDDGRGIPTEVYACGGPPVDDIMTAPHGNMSPVLAEGTDFGAFGGSRAVGVSVVNALSSRVEVEIWRDGYAWFQCFDRTVAGTLERGYRTTKTGTTVRFWPDPVIFETTHYDGHTVALRLQQLASLTKGLTIHLVDERPDGDHVSDFCRRGVPSAAPPLKRRTFRYPNGLQDYVTRINRVRSPIQRDVIHFSGAGVGHNVEIALQWNAGYSRSISTFVNSVDTSNGGTHEEGFRAALTGVVNEYIRDHKLLRDTEPDLGSDVLEEGLAAVISVTIADPWFDDHTKTRLRNPEVKALVQTVCRKNLTNWFQANSADANVIVCKAISSSDYIRSSHTSCRSAAAG